MTDKTDASKKLFFPSCGRCVNGTRASVDSRGCYWADALSVYGASNLIFYDGYWNGDSGSDRQDGLTIRPVYNG